MALAQLTFPAIDLLALTFLAGFGVATLVFVPLWRREHRRGNRAAARSRRQARVVSDALQSSPPTASPTTANMPTANVPTPPPASTPENRHRNEAGETDPESTLPDHEDAASPWNTEEADLGTGRSSNARRSERIELCAAKHRVRFGQAKARLLTISNELELH
ncbi:hypothetical protein ACOQFL_11200 [Actinopolyspora sp. H202]|uniref:hypothetical protein n=1 Tax=Actinopolyspora sp. H202 TaxID=1500456 RepID=UPI003EE651AF